MYMKLTFILLIYFINGTLQQDISEIRTKIDKFVNDLLSCYGVPGTTLAVVKDDQVIVTNGYGLKNLESRQNVTDRTLFVIASVTKQFVATVVGHVLKKHNHTYDTPIRDILGDWFYLKDGYRTRKLTVRDALSHRTGLPGHNFMRIYNYTARELYEKIRHFDYTADLRSQYKYNNLMYGLAAYVATFLEGGKSFEDLAREIIFNPLGMTDTTFVQQARNRWTTQFATPYLSYQGSPRAMSLEHAASFYMTISAPGGISSNAVDMTKWLLAHVNGSSALDPEIILETYKMSMPIGGRPMFQKPAHPVTWTSSASYGLGFRLGYYRGYSMIDHTGSMGGFLSLLNILPDKKMAIFSSSNTGNNNRIRHYIHMYIYDLLLGKEPFLNSTNACPGGEFEDLVNEPMTMDIDEHDIENQNNCNQNKFQPSTNVDNTTGTYNNVAYGNLTIYRNTTDQEVYMSYGPVAHWKLQRRGEDFTFTGIATLPLWSLGVSWIEFKDCDNQPCESVTTSFEWEAPPTFYRNPGPEPAPEPPCTTT